MSILLAGWAGLAAVASGWGLGPSPHISLALSPLSGTET